MKPLNSPHTHIKQTFFKNPFFVLPEPSPLTFPKGRVTPELLMHYGALARTEVALVIAGPATLVPPISRKFSLLRVDQPKYLDGLHALSKVIRANGAIPGIQITHPDGFQADEILHSPDHFKHAVAPLNFDKILAAFRNACVRSCHVGFAYIELNGCDRLYLHRLMAENRDEKVHSLFATILEAAGEQTIVGLRLPAGQSPADRFATLFLELGGDLIGWQAGGQSAVPGIVPERRMANLPAYASPAKLRTLLKGCRLIGLPVSFPDKRRQIGEYLTDIRSLKHGLTGWSKR